MEITLKWLENHNVCKEGLDWWNEHKLDSIEHDKLFKLLLEEEHFHWTVWLIIRVLTQKKLLKYAIYCAELVLPIFEEFRPNNKRPKIAIEYAKKILSTDAAAAYAADAAAYAADAAAYATYAAYYADADAHAAAAEAAYSAAYAAYAHAHAAAYDADADAHAAAAKAAYAAGQKIRHKIIKYGLQLIEEDK
jgi:hypothetical protein